MAKKDDNKVADSIMALLDDEQVFVCMYVCVYACVCPMLCYEYMHICVYV